METGDGMFSNQMFRLSPMFRVLYSTKILRGSYRYRGSCQMKSDHRSRVLQRPCQAVKWSYPSSPCIEDDHISHELSPCALAHFVVQKNEEFRSRVLSPNP